MRVLKKIGCLSYSNWGTCSLYPIEITEWSNKINDGIIKLILEIPGIGAMDFDIKKLFFDDSNYF